MAKISETMGLRADIASVLEKWERTMLEDGKIDLAESAVLLAYAKTQVDRNTKFADFVKLLENVREDGVITPEGDIPALAAEMQRLMEDPARLEEMSAQARKISEAYSEDAVMGRWNLYFTDMLRK